MTTPTMRQVSRPIAASSLHTTRARRAAFGLVAALALLVACGRGDDAASSRPAAASVEPSLPEPTLGSEPAEVERAESVPTEEQLEADRLANARVDIEVRAELTELGPAVFRIDAAVRALNRASFTRPAIIISHAGAVTITTDHGGCTETAAGEFSCVLASVHDQRPDENGRVRPTDWLPLSVELTNVSGEAVEVVVTAASQLNGLGGEPINDPDPSNNSVTITLPLDPS